MRVNALNLLVLFALIALTSARITQFGRCPSGLTPVQNLTLDNFSGRWYKYAKYAFVMDDKCVVGDYGILPNGNISLNDSALNILTSRPIHVTGSAREDAPGKYTVKFDNLPGLRSVFKYLILGTDYKNYTVIYGCDDILGLLNTQVLWILTRERFPDQETVDAATSVAKENGLSLRPLRQIDQQTCPEGH